MGYHGDLIGIWEHHQHQPSTLNQNNYGDLMELVVVGK